ncbi:DB module [Oesophagostomum dentatum]|uniref:DB module n=1 Tax=Oesophagostomum dentatum TaxID=61180 RepID=A0A0B1SRM9_OESDE|nr:DB module [Oesophagostomum dentatum]
MQMQSGDSAEDCSDYRMCTVKLVAAFLTNVCPGPQQRDAFECASSKADHSACCERAGLLAFHGGKCLPFCRAHENRPINPLEFIPCLQVFDHIKACYREYQTTHPNILGD